MRPYADDVAVRSRRQGRHRHRGLARDRTCRRRGARRRGGEGVRDRSGSGRGGPGRRAARRHRARGFGRRPRTPAGADRADAAGVRADRRRGEQRGDERAVRPTHGRRPGPLASGVRGKCRGTAAVGAVRLAGVDARARRHGRERLHGGRGARRPQRGGLWHEQGRFAAPDPAARGRAGPQGTGQLRLPRPRPYGDGPLRVGARRGRAGGRPSAGPYRAARGHREGGGMAGLGRGGLDHRRGSAGRRRDPGQGRVHRLPRPRGAGAAADTGTRRPGALRSGGSSGSPGQ